MKPKLSIIVPCYNEEDNIKLMEENIRKKLKNIDHEIIFVNDGSKDNTTKELKKVTKKSSENIKVVEFSRNFGKDAAIYAGLETSTGEYVVIIDADMQQDPKLIIKMVDEIEKNPNVDIVCYYQSKRIEGGFISFLKKNFYKFISKITKLEFKDGASDFRLFRRNVVDSIISLKENKRFTKGIFSWVGYNTLYLPYVPLERKFGESKFNLIKCIKYAIDGITSFTVKPLEIIIPIGIMFMILSFILLPITLIFGKESILIELLIPLMVNLTGIVIIIIGVVAKYMANIYSDQKNRPIYIAKEIYSTNNVNKKNGE